MNMMLKKVVAPIFICLLSVLAQFSHADRLKDIASVAGVRANQLIGYGLVVGLDGTGDKTPFTTQSFKNMMAKFGIVIPPGVDPKSKNVAAVAIHGELSPFAKPGQTMDVTVSSLGDSKSLRGGTLLITPLKGLDNQVYAIAQGNLVVGGFGVGGTDGSRITLNVPSVGRIPNGATVERAVPNGFARGDSLTFNLNSPDFTTAKRVSDRINMLLGPNSAFTQDAASIQVMAPRDVSQRVSFLSVLENLEIEPAESTAKVIINSRTGTIVIGKHVRVTPAAITHGSLVVTISENFNVSQPGAFSEGETIVTPSTDIDIAQGASRAFVFSPGISLNEIVTAINQVGAAPGDLMAILEALKQAGALKAQIVVI
jgi:flagellar P-ring protein precursor FlgI